MRQSVRNITLKNIWRVPKSGKTFDRTRRGGTLVLIQLPDLPRDHPDFITAWAAARKGNAPTVIDPGSISSIWRAIMASPDARDWSRGYHAIIQRQATAICGKAGHVKARSVRQEHIRADLDTAGDPVARLKAWRIWASWCVTRGIIVADMTVTLRLKRRKTTPRPPWTPAHKADFRARWPIGSVPRAILELTNWTGARASDVVHLGPKMIRADGVLAYRQQKTGEMAYVPWSYPLPRWAAHLHSDRKMMINAFAPFVDHFCFVPTRGGKPRSVKAVVQLFQRCCRELEIPVGIHGLRKTRAVDLINGGATSQEGAS